MSQSFYWKQALHYCQDVLPIVVVIVNDYEVIQHAITRRFKISVVGRTQEFCQPVCCAWRMAELTQRVTTTITTIGAVTNELSNSSPEARCQCPASGYLIFNQFRELRSLLLYFHISIPHSILPHVCFPSADGFAGFSIPVILRRPLLSTSMDRNHSVITYMLPRSKYHRLGFFPKNFPQCVHKIAPDTVAKVHLYTHEAITEALNLSMLRSMTTIPVPEVRQVVVNASSNTYIVMEYIDGETLASCWDRLSLLSKLRIAWTLRGYIGQLRRLRRSVPGTLDGVACTGPIFTDYGAGPFTSYDEMTTWLNHKLDVAQQMKRAPLDAPRFDNSWPLVFTHQDLCPRNIMLARDGKVYMVDWEGSGFYPSWFE
ncbi:kinase-like domain-containing protein [Suillus lakei]|nr:kinase-like domain-containing protein [Suillus lakei]